MKALTVETTEGSVAAYEQGTPAAGTPTLVLAHGWPDSHEVWDPVADRLAGAHHVVTFDSRGVGASSTVDGPDAYSLERMADDLDAVIAHVSPDRPVHLVGHDWGSVEGWEYVVRDGVERRVASFTSVSGPNLDYLGDAVRTRTRRGGPSIRPVLAQAAKSSYTIVLSLPVIRTALWRAGFARPFRLWLKVTEGIARDSGYPGSDVANDAIASVPLYRTNIWPKLRRPDPRPARVPVQVIVATEDKYVNPDLVAEVADWVDDLTVNAVAAGHWSPRTHPDDIVDHIAGYVSQIENRHQESTSA